MGIPPNAYVNDEGKSGKHQRLLSAMGKSVAI